MIPILLSRNYYSNLYVKSNFDRENLGPYLTGLIEGDGHIYTPSELRYCKGKKRAPSIEISFDIKDLPLFEKN